MSPEEIGNQYNQVVHEYVKIRSATIGVNFADRFLSLLPTSPTVLDIGCGPGVPLTKQLVSHGAKVIAVDISEKMIERAKDNVPEAEYIHADIITWNPEIQFDGIFAWDSLFHLPMEKQEQTLLKILNWLKPNGVAMFTTGGGKGEVVSEMFGKMFYYSSLSIEEYKDVISESGAGLLFSEMDDPSSHGHRVMCCIKQES